MKLLLLILLACSCAGTDLKPDEFRVDFGKGHTDMDSATTTTPGWWDPSRSFETSGDSSSQWFSFGWTWKLGDVAQREHEDAYLARLYEPREPSAPAPKPVPVVVAAHESAPEPKHEEQAPWKSALPYIPALALAVIGALNRMGKVDWLAHKEH